MKQLIIAGAGGFAREVLWLAQRNGIPTRGFLVDDADLAGTVIHGIPVLGAISEWEKHPDCQFVIAVGSPRGKQKILATMTARGAPDFTSLVDPSAQIGNQVQIGAGAIICAGVICTTDITIGSHAIVNLNCTLGHDVSLGDFVTVAPNVGISGNVSVGKGVEIGTGAAIREKLSVGEGAMVGMGSVVTRDIAPNTTVVGNPAKILKSTQ